MKEKKTITLRLTRSEALLVHGFLSTVYHAITNQEKFEGIMDQLHKELGYEIGGSGT